MTTKRAADWEVIAWVYGTPMRVSAHKDWVSAKREASRWERDGHESLVRYANRERPYWWDLASEARYQKPGAVLRYEQARKKDEEIPPIDVAISVVSSALVA